MPGAIRESLMDELPKLQAEETQRFATAVAYGAGRMKPADAKRWWNTLTKMVRGRRHVQRAASLEEHLQNLEDRGFTIRRVES